MPPKPDTVLSVGAVVIVAPEQYPPLTERLYGEEWYAAVRWDRIETLRRQKRLRKRPVATSRLLAGRCRRSVFETSRPSSKSPVTADSPSDFDYQLQTLARADIEPDDRLRESDEIRLSAAKRTVDQNYYELDEYIDGELRTNPIFLCHTDRVEEEGFEALRLLHNYLASLYSLNETIRVLCNRYSSPAVELTGGDFTPVSGGNDESYYGRKLGFLRGLRTDFQHGGFSCLTFEKAGELGDFEGYHVVFDRKAFITESGLREPNRFLRWTNEAEQRHPISYIGTFHQRTLQDFYDDVERWFASA